MPQEIVRAWLSLDTTGSPALVPSACAKPSTIRFDREGKSLTFQLNPCPEKNAVLMGSRWRLAEGRFTGMFRGRVSGSHGKLLPVSAGYSIDTEDIQTASFRAYCEPRGNEANQMEAQVVAIVPHHPEAMSVKLLPGGEFEASADLDGKEIHCQVIYGSGIVMTDKPLGEATGYLLLKSDLAALSCLRLEGASIEISGESIRLSYQNENEVPIA